MDEYSFRHALGIPGDARRVLIFSESSHWDPNWLMTSEEYYRFVDRNLDAAIGALEAEPRRVYSVECVFFLRMYWERHPERQEAIRRLVNERRLRMTGSGVTTADTLLPKTESILRDMLLGQEWLRANGMTQEPRLAYFTDSFGCSPSLPSLLRAAGFDRTAFTRIDGMYFQGCEYEAARNYPRPGSSAARLLLDEKTLDFVWRDVNGAEVLCHWNAFTYGQGDMLAHRGIVRMYDYPAAFPDRSERHVASRIAGYVRQLAPVSRSPYMLCPIGLDFVEPVPDLVALLDRYNRVRYPVTGVWAVNAGLDDYLALVERHVAGAHGVALPVVELEPNPYWTGFYTSRPALKRRCHDLVEDLVLAERLSLLPECQPMRQVIREDIAAAWWDAAASNHHDFITGTSPDRVAQAEQWPWIERSSQAVCAAVECMEPLLPRVAAAPQPAGVPRWSATGGNVCIETPCYVVELSERAGGCIVRAASPDARTAWLSGPSNDLVSYRDSGGLWRMGHEYRGGTLTPAGRASERRSALQVREVDEGLEVASRIVLDGEEIWRWLWFRADSPVIRGRVLGRAGRRRTIGLAFATPLAIEGVSMAQPGGVVTRPPRKLHDPTYWPAQDFVHFHGAAGGPGIAVCLPAAPSSAACRDGGGLEVVALRNATRERAYGLVPLLANPATGYESTPYSFDYAILLTEHGDWRANRLPAAARRLAQIREVRGEAAALTDLVADQVVIDGGAQMAEVEVLAFKPASRGDGLILRLATATPPLSLVIGLRDAAITSASLCDARERNVEPLEVRDGRAHLAMAGSINTLRLLADL